MTGRAVAVLSLPASRWEMTIVRGVACVYVPGLVTVFAHRQSQARRPSTSLSHRLGMLAFLTVVYGEGLGHDG